MKKKWRKILGAFFIFIFSLLSSFSVFAESESLSLSPGLVQITLSPGETLSKELTIENKTNETAKIKLYLSPYKIKNEDYEIGFEESDFGKNNEMRDWILFENKKSTESFELKKNSSKNIALKIKFPDEEKEIQYLLIFAEATFEKSPEKILRVASLMIADPENKEGDLIWNFLNQSAGLSSENISTEVFIENSENASENVFLTFTVETLLGKKLFEEKKEGIIFPEHPRKIRFEWVESPKFGFYKVKTAIKTSGNSEENETIVFLLPFPPMVLPIFLLTFIIFVLIIRSKKNLKQKV